MNPPHSKQTHRNVIAEPAVSEPRAPRPGGPGARRIVVAAMMISALLGIGPTPALLADSHSDRQAPTAITPASPSPDSNYDSEPDMAHDQHRPTSVGYEETVEEIDDTARRLKFAQQQLASRNVGRQLAMTSMNDLEQQSAAVAEETVDAAITLYQDRAIHQTIFSSDKINAGLRASTLGTAAVGSEHETFERFFAVRKNLEQAEAELRYRDARVDQTRTEVAHLEDELSNRQQWLAELEEAQLQQRAATAGVQASVRAQFRGRKQGFYLDTCPINGPHQFIDSWGFARSGGRSHKGVDMLADRGTELVAPVGGFVEHYSNSLGGRSFRLTDANGNYYYGTHMSGFGKQGDVLAGEVIGYVGDDGNAAGINHLHFEIHPGGRGNPINPFIDTASVCSGAQS